MKNQLTLRTTKAQFDGLHASIEGVRSTSTTVKVDKQALVHLLMDHSKLVAALRGDVMED